MVKQGPGMLPICYRFIRKCRTRWASFGNIRFTRSQSLLMNGRIVWGQFNSLVEFKSILALQ